MVPRNNSSVKLYASRHFTYYVPFSRTLWFWSLNLLGHVLRKDTLPDVQRTSYRSYCSRHFRTAWKHPAIFTECSCSYFAAFSITYLRSDTPHNYVFHVHPSGPLHSTEYLVLTKATMVSASDSVGYSLAVCSKAPNNRQENGKMVTKQKMGTDVFF